MKKAGKGGWLAVCVFTLMAGGIFPSGTLAAECGEPNTCVALVRINGGSFCRKPGKGGLAGFPLIDVTGYQTDCEYIQTTRVGSVDNCFYPTAMHMVGYLKWYWDGSAWRYHSSASGFYKGGDSSHTALPPVPGEIVINQHVDIYKLYPNGCSDLPSQQPAIIPSPNTGDPQCNQISLE